MINPPRAAPPPTPRAAPGDAPRSPAKNRKSQGRIIFPLPTRHWSLIQVYSPSPHVIGPSYGYMPPPFSPLECSEFARSLNKGLTAA
eukprot:265886-Pyramimonas_sp.AAC.1